MANVVLHAQDLLETARRIDAASDKIDNALQKLDTIMGDLDSVWSDQNSKRYLERYNELKSEFPEFKKAVRSYGTFLNSVVNTYQKEFSDETRSTIN